VLWVLVNLGEKGRWTRSDLTLQAIAEAAGLSSKECASSLERLFHARFDNGSGLALNELAADRHLIELTLARKLDELPTWTEEVVMSVLCSSAGGSIADIYESVLGQGLSVGAVYKVVERLKNEGFVYPERYYRVNDRGPMREMLSADCRNCFFGFTSPDRCLQDTLRQLDGVLQRDYNLKPTAEEKATLQASMKVIPYCSRINRRVLASLRLMHELDRMTREGRVSGLLRKIEEHYHVDLPIKTRSKPTEDERAGGLEGVALRD